MESWRKLIASQAKQPLSSLHQKAMAALDVLGLNYTSQFMSNDRRVFLLAATLRLMIQLQVFFV